MECFVYLRMRGKRENMVLRLLDDSHDLVAKLAKFDASQSRCYLDADRQRLLAVVESGFGSFVPFNGLCRSIFAEQLLGK